MLDILQILLFMPYKLICYPLKKNIIQKFIYYII